MSSASSHTFWTFWIISLLVHAHAKVPTARFSSYMSEFEYSPGFHPSRNPACPARFVRRERLDDDGEFIVQNLPSIQIGATMLRCGPRDGNGVVGFKIKSKREAQNCAERIAIQMKFNNVGKMKTEEEFLVVDQVRDPITMKSFRLKNPYVIKVRQEPVLHLYGLKFQGVVNAEAREEVINNRNSNYTGCNDGAERPTCGQLFIDGEPIPFSQGFCCSCDRRVNENRQHGEVKKFTGSFSVGPTGNRSETETVRTNSHEDSWKTFADAAPSNNSTVKNVSENSNVVHSGNGLTRSAESMDTRRNTENGSEVSTLLSKKESTETSNSTTTKPVFKDQYLAGDEGSASTVTSFLEKPTSYMKTRDNIQDDHPAKSMKKFDEVSWNSNRIRNYEKNEVQGQSELTTKSLRESLSLEKTSGQKGSQRFHSKETKRKTRKFLAEKSSNHVNGTLSSMPTKRMDSYSTENSSQEKLPHDRPSSGFIKTNLYTLDSLKKYHSQRSVVTKSAQPLITKSAAYEVIENYTPQKRTLKELAYKENRDHRNLRSRGTKIQVRKGSRLPNSLNFQESSKPGRISGLKKSSKRCNKKSTRHRRRDEWPKNTGDYGGKCGSRRTNSSHDVQVFMDYPRPRLSHSREKCREYKSHGGEDATSSTDSTDVKSSDVNDDLFPRDGDDRQKKVDEQIEEKFARISDVLKDDVLEATPDKRSTTIASGTTAEREVGNLENTEGKFERRDEVSRVTGREIVGAIRRVGQCKIGEKIRNSNSANRGANEAEINKTVYSEAPSIVASGFNEKSLNDTSTGRTTTGRQIFREKFRPSANNSAAFRAEGWTSKSRIVPNLKISHDDTPDELRETQLINSLEERSMTKNKETTVEPISEPTNALIIVDFFRVLTSPSTETPFHVAPTYLPKEQIGHAPQKHGEEGLVGTTETALSFAKNTEEISREYFGYASARPVFLAFDEITEMDVGKITSEETSRITDPTFRPLIERLPDVVKQASTVLHNELSLDDTAFPDETVDPRESGKSDSPSAPKSAEDIFTATTRGKSYARVPPAIFKEINKSEINKSGDLQTWTSRCNENLTGNVDGMYSHDSSDRKKGVVGGRGNDRMRGRSAIRKKPAMKYLVEAENIERNFLKMSMDNWKKSISDSKDHSRIIGSELQLKDRNNFRGKSRVSRYNQNRFTNERQIGRFNGGQKKEHPWCFTTVAPEFVATWRNNIGQVFVGKTTPSILQHSALDKNGIDDAKIVKRSLETNERRRRLLSIPKPRRTKEGRDRHSSSKNNIRHRDNRLYINTNTDVSNEQNFDTVRKPESPARVRHRSKPNKRNSSRTRKSNTKRKKKKRSKKHLFDYSDNRYLSFPNFRDRGKQSSFEQRDYEVDDKGSVELFPSYEPIAGPAENLDRNVNAGPSVPGITDELSTRNQLYQINDFEDPPNVNDAADQSGPSEDLLSKADGRDLKISLTGKIHVDAGPNGREFSVSLDGVPELLRKDSPAVDEKLDRNVDSSPSLDSIVDDPLSISSNFSPDDLRLRSTSSVLPGGLEQANQADDGVYVGSDGLRRYEDQPTGDRFFGSHGNSADFRERLAYKNALLRHRMLRKDSGKFDELGRNLRGFSKYSKLMVNGEDGSDVVPEKSEAEDVEEESDVDDESSNVERRNRVSISSSEPVIKEEPSVIKSSGHLVHFPDIFQNFLSNEKSDATRNSDTNSCYKMNSTLKKLEVLETTTMKNDNLLLHKKVPSANYHSNNLHGHSNKIPMSTSIHNTEYPEKYTNFTETPPKDVEPATKDATELIERKNAIAIVEFVKKLEELASNVGDPKNKSGNPVIHLKKFIIVPEIRSSRKKYEPSITTTERAIITEEATRRGESREEKASKMKEIFVDQRSDTFQDYADGSAEPTVKNSPGKESIPSRVNSDVIPLYSLTGRSIKGKSRCLAEDFDREAISQLASFSRETFLKTPAELPTFENRREAPDSSFTDTKLRARNNRPDNPFSSDNSEIGRDTKPNCPLTSTTENGSKSWPGSNQSPHDPTADFRSSVHTIESRLQDPRRNADSPKLGVSYDEIPSGRPTAGQQIAGQRVATLPKLGENFLEVSVPRGKTARVSPSRRPRRKIDFKSCGIKACRVDPMEKRAAEVRESVSESLNEVLRRETSGNRGGISPAKETSRRKRRRKLRRKKKRRKKVGKKKSDKNVKTKRNLLPTSKKEVPRSFADKSRGRRGASERADLPTNSRNEPQFSCTRAKAEYPSKRKLLAITDRQTLREQSTAEECNRKGVKDVISEHQQIRGGQDCAERGNPSRYQESAHCLRFSDLWYSVYRLEEPVIDHRVRLEIYERRTLPDGTTLWHDLVRGSAIRLGSFDRHYENPEGTVAFEYNEIKLRSRRQYSLDPVRDRLLIPSSISQETLKYSEYEGYLKEYLVLDEDAIREDGKECDFAGVGFAAFHEQPDRCDRVRGTCLKNQPLTYWRQDTEARSSGRPGCYFLSNFASVPSETIRYVNGSGSREFLALEYQSPHVSVVDVLLRAVENVSQRARSFGRITEVYVDNTFVDRTVISITIANRGPSSATYRPRIVGCPATVTSAWSRAEGPAKIVAPRRERKLAMELDGRLTLDEFSCVVELINRDGETVAARGIRVRKMDRCYCAWHRACTCVGEDLGTLLLSKGIFVVLPITVSLLALLILGFAKWLIGIFSPAVSRWGLDALLGPAKMEEYFERKLKSKDLVVDRSGAPVHPDTGKRSVRICNRKLEFFLNVLFFYTYPCAICCAKAERSTAVQYSDESKTTLISERDERPRMVNVSTYGDSVNSAMELEDTKYVIDELKKSQESLRNQYSQKPGSSA